MKHLSFLLIFTLGSALAQKKGELSSTRLVNLDIISVRPYSSSDIEIIFRAQDYDTDEPIWDLAISDLIVTEDTIDCEKKKTRKNI